MGKLKQILKKAMLWFYAVMARLLPVDSHKIVFQSSLGRNATGSPRAIYEKIVELGLDQKYKCYYILDEPEKYKGKLPGRVKLLKNARFWYYITMVCAGVWVSDTRFQNYIIKRKGVKYLQTWHGTPLKKLALDLEALYMAGEETLEDYKREFVRNAETWDFLISQNSFSTKVFRQAFGYSKKMLEIGYPRNDILFLPLSKEMAEKEKQKLGLPAKKRVMLYAPTWRDNAFYNKADYRFDSPMDFEAMRRAFGEEYILVVKYHYMVREKKDWGTFAGFVYPVGDEADIAALYRISELLITDYSSVMFDYSILHRPIFFYAYDLEAYRDNLRGFYFDMEQEVPGPIVTTTEELVQAITETQKEAELETDYKTKAGEEISPENDITVRKETEENQASEELFPANNIIAQKTQAERTLGQHDDNYNRISTKYRERYQNFCKKYNSFDTGHASEKVVKLLLK